MRGGRRALGTGVGGGVSGFVEEGALEKGARGFVPERGTDDSREGGCETGAAERGGSVRRPGKGGNESTCGLCFSPKRAEKHALHPEPKLECATP